MAQSTAGVPAETRELHIGAARIPGYLGLQQVWVDSQGLITAIQPMDPADPAPSGWARIDLKGDWLSLGGVDLQINGALGLAFPDLGLADPSVLQKIGRFLWDQGVDGYLPTIVTTAVNKIHQALAVVAAFEPPRQRRSPRSWGCI